MAVILIVEEHVEVLKKLSAVFSEHHVIPVRTVAAARVIFEERHCELDMILLDGPIGSADLEDETIRFVKDIRAAGFTKRVIAISANPYMLERQVEAGCSEGIHKYELMQLRNLVRFGLARQNIGQ